MQPEGESARQANSPRRLTLKRQPPTNASNPIQRDANAYPRHTTPGSPLRAARASSIAGNDRDCACLPVTVDGVLDMFRSERAASGGIDGNNVGEWRESERGRPGWPRDPWEPQCCSGRINRKGREVETGSRTRSAEYQNAAGGLDNSGSNSHNGFEVDDTLESDNGSRQGKQFGAVEWE